MKVIVCEVCGWRNDVPQDHHGIDPRFRHCLNCVNPLS